MSNISAEARDRYNARARQKYAENTEYREKHIAQVRQRRHAQYADPEYRAKCNAQVRQRRRARYADPAYREKRNAQARQRYAADYEHREKIRAQKRQRYVVDPEFRKKRRTAACNAQRAKNQLRTLFTLIAVAGSAQNHMGGTSVENTV